MMPALRPGGVPACRLESLAYTAWMMSNFLSFFARQFFPPVHDDIHIARIVFHRVALPAELLTGDQGGAAAPKQIQHQLTGQAAVSDQPPAQRDRLHGGVLGVAGRFVAA